MKKNKILKRLLIAVVVIIVLFFGASFAADRFLMGQTFARVTPSAPTLTPSEDYMKDYKSTPVEFQMDGSTLRGYVYEADDPKGFIIFRHGIASKHEDYLALISAMVDRGWTVFAYDAIGCGISDGDDVKGMAQSALDVAYVVNYVRDVEMAGDLPLVLWGHSWGGYGVAAALDIVPDVDACVTMSGYNSPVEVLAEGTERIMGGIAKTQYPTIWLNNKLSFGNDSDRTAVDGINKTSAPVLIIHGTADEIVSYGGSGIIAKRDQITNDKVEYLVVDEPGRNGHNSYFYSAESNAYLNEKATEVAELKKLYPNGVPDEAVQEFLSNFDAKLGNTADPALIDAIDGFLTKSVTNS